MRVVISSSPADIRRRCGEILVAAAGEIDHHQMIFGLFGASFDTLAMACAGSSAGMMPSSREQQLERRQRLVVGRGENIDAAGVVQPGMLRPDAGIIQAGRNRMRLWIWPSSSISR
jgi:hypothetical protein